MLQAEATSSWWTSLSPWIQGLFGGAGATLLWEAVIKPTRERSGLAHALAEEVALNLQQVAFLAISLERKPKSFPGDFAYVTTAFDALSPRLGELGGPLVGETLTLYSSMKQLNTMPAVWSETLDRYNEARRDPANPFGLAGLGGQLQRLLVLLRHSVEVTIERSNAVLPKLRRAAIPWWRPDLLLRTQPSVSMSELRRLYDEVEEERQKLA